ncbi:MAG: hypothetical protein LBL60_03120 [Mycoplasmataceae bacterium]|jgi:4-diphosphocytidyl-2-C-methyl-D-erythritol kinase|nr:hypothetical protein [Mycoplasmataceae bacterium]
MLLKAYSKINFILKVYPKTNNNKLHKIQSLMVLNKKFYDEININKSNIDSIVYNKVKISNCVVKRMLIWFRNRFNINDNYKIKIKKNIPLMSGVGGSATDAAHILKYLLNLYHLSLTKKDLKDIALNIGSDIPFFLSNLNKAIVSEYGNNVREFNKIIPAYQLIFTKAKINSKKLYGYMDCKQFKSKVDFNKALQSLLCNKNSYKGIYNDMQEFAFKLDNNLLNKYQQMSKHSKILISGTGGAFIKLDYEN